jgi:DNA-binding FadR family transcriptional regulator
MTQEPVRRQANVGAHVRVPKSAELVAQALRMRIVRGELQEGDGLPPENVLMQQFGVSRPTLREAFRILESEQLITIHRGARGGGRVHAPSGEVAARYAALVLQHQGTSLRDVYRASAVIEPACAALLASRRTSQQLKELRAAAEAPRGSADAPHRVDGARDFHRLIVEMAGNHTLTLLSRMVEQILALAGRSDAGVDGGPANRRRLIRAHRTHAELVELIESRDPAGAEQVWAKHLADVQTLAIGGSDLDVPIDLFG